MQSIPAPGSGPARATVLTGPAGIGRTALLRAFCAAAAPRSSVLETDRLDGTWRVAPGSAPAGPSPARRSPLGTGPVTRHRLHETVGELGRERPVVLAMDDAHLERPRSLHALDYVLRRSGGRPVLAVITVPSPATAEPAALSLLLAHHPWHVEHLQPLTAGDVAELLRRRLGRHPDAALLRRCLHHTRAVPAAVHAFADRQAALRGAENRRTPARHPSPAPGRLPGSATAVLSAVAVLGCADADLVSELIRVPLPAVRRALAHLAEHHALPLGDGRAPSDGLPDGATGETADGHGDDLIPLYARAARLLEDAGRPPGQVADVLLRVPYAEPWMLQALYSAALDAKSPDRAVRYLSHALDLGAGQDAPMVRKIRARLARSLTSTEPAAALPHLRVLLGTSADGRELADAALRYADAFIALGDGDEAARLLAEVLDRAPGSGAVTVPEDCRPALESAMLLSGSLRQGRTGRPGERSPEDAGPGGASADRRLRLADAALAVLSGHPAPLPDGAVVTTAGDPGTPLDDLSLIASAVLATLADRTSEALRTLDRILGRPDHRGPGLSRAMALTVRALLRSGTGDLPAAELDARQAVERARRGDRTPGTVSAAVVFAYVLAQRGRAAAAQGMLSQVNGTGLGTLSDVQPMYWWCQPMYWWSRAAVRRAHGDLPGALVALRCSGRSLGPGRAESPVLLPWWLEAADLLTEMGRFAEARQVAAQAGELVTRWDTARGAGLAALARGLATPGPDGHRLLDEACAHFAASPARLLRARAEYALGRALLTTGDPRSARPRLRTALDLMTGCGAGSTADGVRRRLAEAGGRPHRRTGHPGNALTGRERRVALMAMAGRSNREIAEALYITRRTVELHLTHTFQKLGVSRREDLAGVLRGSPGDSACRAGGEPR
ncbi:LuxR C-terminal-related transcriptional regulator [Streptomyces bungoensis]|uniref:LuxR C-terminal-related transcriptional regulator n=1 Tax=Streptomyces bungoensis TaxID=285568 RepID=UPI003F4D08B5